VIRGRRASARLGVNLGAVLVCAILGAGGQLAGAASALAATGHRFVATVTEAPLGSSLGEPGAVVVDRSSGQELVVDSGRGAVLVLNAAGAFETAIGEGLEVSGVAVDEATGLVYVTSEAAVLVFGSDGHGGYSLLAEWTGAATPAGEFGELRGVAVDNSKGPSAGDVYVADAANGVVDVFKARPAGPEEGEEAAFLSTLKGVKLEEPNAVAIDASSGRVYVADSSKGLVAIYSPSGVFEGKLTGAGSPEGTFRGSEGEEGNVRALAVEEGDLYVAEGERHVVSEFNAAGEWIGWVTGTPSGGFAEPDGVAVAPSGEVYVSDALAGQLDIFGAGVAVPDAQTGGASKVAKTSAVFNGVVNGDGMPAKYRFEWGPTEAYGSTTAFGSAGPGEEKVKAEVAGLSPGTSYHFRLVVENENGSNVAADREFETLPAVEGVSTGPVSNLEPTEATLNGALAPNGTDVHYVFDWGTTTSYGQATPSTDAGSAKEVVAAKAELSGLAPNTSYHYRLVGSNSYGTTLGQDQSFTTSGPPLITRQPPSAVSHEAASLNAKVDPGELETTYRFEYGETASYGTETPAGKLAASAAFTPVAAALTGLKIGTVYHYRLVAENSAGRTIEPDQTVETVPPALIENTSATEVGSATATLQAQINPLGHETTYYLQYGTSPCEPRPELCIDLPAAPGTDIGAGEAPVPVSQHLTELTPSTTYYYRAIATNSLGTSEGPERRITSQPGEAPVTLADDRAWEMVTPPNKHGAPVEALTREGGLILAAENGESLTYVANGSLVEEPQGNRSPEQQQNMATRTPEGWVTQDIATPSARAQGVAAGAAPEYQYFTPTLTSALVEPWGDTPFSEPPLAPEAKQKTMYLRDNGAGTYLPLVTEANVAPGTSFGQKLEFVSATPDLSHVVLRSAVPLAPPPAGQGLYEWSAGSLQFVSLLPDGAAASEAALGFDGRVVSHAVSNDGNRVIWTSKDENTAGGHLYLSDTATSQTLQLDAAQGVSEPGTGSAEFQGASPDGAEVLFTDKQRLTADSTAEPEFPPAPDLYQCEVVEEAGKLACHLKDLTAEGDSHEHADVLGLLLGSSEDESSVALVAQGVLAGNTNGNGEAAEAGRDNLYWLQYDDGSWTTTFVAQLSPEDAPEWEGNRVADTAFLTARVSPNGRYLAFMSNATPTGYDNRDQASGKPDEEVYLYDANTASLTCVSCNPTGARPHGVLDTVEAGEGLGLVVDRRKIWAEQGHEHWLAGNIPGWTAESLVSALFQSRYLSNEGRLFFNSPDYLVPQAKSGKESVYEYEPNGIGSCESQTGGCVSLVSSGTASNESAFLEATPNGSDVFFLTAAALLPQDTDTAFDIYDARICTEASPCLTPPAAAPPECSSSSACRPAQPGQPAPLEASGSAVPTGQGNLSSRPLARQEPLGIKVSSPKPITRAQQLAKALKACKRQHSRKKRAKCEAQARRKYAKGKAHKANSRTRRRTRS
jgi:phosphodiesterase/alkaline phosphatase D-like protein/sugar lactone lactonase YvrE